MNYPVCNKELLIHDHVTIDNKFKISINLYCKYDRKYHYDFHFLDRGTFQISQSQYISDRYIIKQTLSISHPLIDNGFSSEISAKIPRVSYLNQIA